MQYAERVNKGLGKSPEFRTGLATEAQRTEEVGIEAFRLQNWTDWMDKRKPLVQPTPDRFRPLPSSVPLWLIFRFPNFFSVPGVRCLDARHQSHQRGFAKIFAGDFAGELAFAHHEDTSTESDQFREF